MKKRTLAIILSVVLVVSAVVALAACKKTQEYTITFRDTAGKMLEVVTTVDGKATPSAKTTTKPGYTHDGWYREVSADENDKYTYTGLVDLATTVFTEDTDLYAKWKRNLTAGEEAGYCVIGKITGLTDEWPNGGFDPESAMNCEEAQLTHSDTEINLYYITLDVKALDSFKIKTSSEGWDDGEINGLSPLVDKGEVKLGADVELPQGITKAYDLFTYTYEVDNNLSPKCDMNITINFYYNADESYADIVINSIDSEIVKTPEEVGFVLVGDLTGWEDKAPYDGTANAKYILATEDNNVFTLEGVELPALTSFQIKGNESGWRTQFGMGTLDKVTVAEGVELPADITKDTAITLFAGDAGNAKGNISPKREMTVNITLTYSAKKIEIEITEVDTTVQVSDDDKGYIVIGDLSAWEPGFEADGAHADFIMQQDAENSHLFTLTNVNLPVDNSFRIKCNNNAWIDPQYAYNKMTVEVAQGVELPEGKTKEDIFKDDGGNDHNIIVKHHVKATLTLNTEAATLTVTITWVDSNAVLADNEIGYAICGKINGNPDKTMNWVAYDPNYKMTADDEKEVFTITGVKLLSGDAFQVKVAKDAWVSQYNASNATFEFDEAIDSTALVMSDYLANESGNVTAKAAVTVTIVFIHSTHSYTVTITEIATTDAPAA